MGGVVADILVYIIFVNIILMVFNLIPVPPLDGFGLLTQVFDLRRKSWYDSVYNNGFVILMALLIFDVIDRVLTPTVNFIFNLIMGLFFG
jgi:Zn-dependent protease